jgi:hypothetical protein
MHRLAGIDPTWAELGPYDATRFESSKADVTGRHWPQVVMGIGVLLAALSTMGLALYAIYHMLDAAVAGPTVPLPAGVLAFVLVAVSSGVSMIVVGGIEYLFRSRESIPRPQSVDRGGHAKDHLVSLN